MADHDSPGCDPDGDAAERPREPYAGIVQSIMVKLLVNPSSPRAAQQRRIIHRLFVVGWIVFGATMLGLLVVMIAALVNS